MEKVDVLYQKEISDHGGYGKYIGHSLNRLAKVNGDNEFSVSITFSNVKIPDITCNEIKVTRIWNERAGESVEVLIDGHRNELIEDLRTDGKQNGEEIFIRDFILPIEIAKFFFFDAEKIVSLAEINSPDQRKLLSKAYTEVLGIKKYEDLKDQLESIQDEYRKKSASRKDKADLNQLITDIDNADIQINEIEENIEELRKEKAEKRLESDDIQRKLIQEGNQITLEQLEDLKGEEADWFQKIETLQEELKELYDFIPFGLAGETLIEISTQIKHEKDFRDNTFRQEDIQEKISQFLIEIEEQKKELPHVVPVEIRDFYESQIKRLIPQFFGGAASDLPSNFVVLHDFSDAEINEFNSLAESLRQSLRDRYKSLYERFSSAKTEHDGVRRKIREAEKDAEDDYIAGLRSRKSELDKRIVKIEEDINTLHQEIGSIKAKQKTLRQNQEILRKKIDTSRNFSDKEEKAQEIIQQLKSFIRAFKEEKKKSLEKSILDELSKLMHKKGFIKKVVVDISQSGDDVDINLFDKRNHKIDKGSLSMGERQMYASSLLKALVDESDIEFPVFIDSPMQKFDKDHARNIIKEFYPNVSEQVVIFPLIHKELTSDEFDLLKGNISAAYLINNLDVDSSEFLKTVPEELITTYDEIENANKLKNV